jgi:hypothetical protein
VVRPTHTDTIVNVYGDHAVVTINHYDGVGTDRVMTQDSVEETPPLPPPPPPDPLPAPQHPFDGAAARMSLHEVDLSACRIDGVHGDGHAKVTFSPAGNVTDVVIDTPHGLGIYAVRCIGTKLASARVPAFGGDAVTTGITYYVP